jgi:hypothetical protein
MGVITGLGVGGLFDCGRSQFTHAVKWGFQEAWLTLVKEDSSKPSCNFSRNSQEGDGGEEKSFMT